MNNTVERLAYSPLEAAAALGVSKNLIYAMLATGQIKSIRAGDSRKKIIIPKACLDEFLMTAQGGGK